MGTGVTSILIRSSTRICDQYGLSDKEAKAILGLEGSTPCLHSEATLAKASLFISTISDLEAVVGGDMEKARIWLTSANFELSGYTPLQLIQTEEGLVRVARVIARLAGRE